MSDRRNAGGRRRSDWDPSRFERPSLNLRDADRLYGAEHFEKREISAKQNGPKPTSREKTGNAPPKRSFSANKIELRPGTILAPLPAVLIGCEHNGVKNVFTAAWTGICCTHPATLYVSVRPERFSYGLIKNSGEFTVNLPTSTQIRQVDLCGMKSGRDVDKFELCHFTPIRGNAVSAPLIAECPMALECRVTQAIELGSHTMFLAEILAVRPDATLMNADGKLCLERAGLTCYSHGSYYTVGKKIGSFGYSMKKKRTAARPPRKKKKENENDPI